jgi:hypothetical protein
MFLCCFHVRLCSHVEDLQLLCILVHTCSHTRIIHIAGPVADNLFSFPSWLIFICAIVLILCFWCCTVVVMVGTCPLLHVCVARQCCTLTRVCAIWCSRVAILASHVLLVPWATACFCVVFDDCLLHNCSGVVFVLVRIAMHTFPTIYYCRRDGVDTCTLTPLLWFFIVFWGLMFISFMTYCGGIIFSRASTPQNNVSFMLARKLSCLRRNGQGWPQGRLELSHA